MRFHTTIGFGDKLKAVNLTHGEFIEAFERGSESDEEQDKMSCHLDAIIDCLQYPAVTPAELRLKLQLYRDNNVSNWADRSVAICDDVVSMSILRLAPGSMP